VELVLPLLGEASGADDEAGLEVTSGDELLKNESVAFYPLRAECNPG
jgi:hypothetical protein